MRRYAKGIDLYDAHRAWLKDNAASIREGHAKLAEEGKEDFLDLTKGQPPNGKARRRLLRQLGHPYGRGQSAASSTPTGRARGAPKAVRQSVGLKGQLPYLPIGIISGRLRRAIRKQKVHISGYTDAYAVGPSGVAYAAYILGDAGTRKMVGRGFQREVRKRWKARKRALIDHIAEQQNS